MMGGVVLVYGIKNIYFWDDREPDKVWINQEWDYNYRYAQSFSDMCLIYFTNWSLVVHPHRNSHE